VLKLRPRSSFWFTRAMNLFGAKGMWTTVGDTIYYPDHIKNPEAHRAVLTHEAVHIEQYKKYSIFGFLFLYVFVFLPIGLSYFRWRFEREGYVESLKSDPVFAQQPLFAIDAVVNTLWRHYGWPWPRFLMRKWFRKNLKVA